MPFTVRVQNFQSIADATIEVDGFTVVTGPNNSGKALRDGTLIATPTGWLPVESLGVGNLVLAGDGTPTRVLGVYPQGVRKTCKILFEDGRGAIVDEDHLWDVSIGTRRFPKGEDASQRWETLTTRDIRNRVGVDPSAYMRPAIPQAGPAHRTQQPTPLDPYLLGALLGDGCFQPTSVRISSADTEVISEVAKALPPQVTLRPAGGYDYRLTRGKGRPNPVLDAVRALGLADKKAHEKSIPKTYLWNGIPERVALLQGLMDTDGTVNRQGISEFTSTSEPLARGVMEIIYSLGGTARIRHKNNPAYTYKGERRTGRTAYTVTIRLPGFELFRLPRKQCLVKSLDRRVQPLMVSFREGPVASCTCIEVEHGSHLFQMEGHLVTHNTALQRAIRGVFTNAPPGPLVRHGAAHLTVEITFEDGQTVKWEKGWNKPDQKGGTVNSYTVNGKKLSTVGRGAPEEVLALGIKPIKAGDRTLWPQIADQFSGVLFLVDNPGSVIAEAIADVDRVGQLSTALKLSESDRRKASSKLGTRREDEDKLALELATYTGLDTVAEAIVQLQEEAKEAEKTRQETVALTNLRDRHDVADGIRNRLSGVREVQVPPKAGVETTVKTGALIRSLGTLHKRLGIAQTEASRLAPVADIEVPDEKVVKSASSTQAKLSFAVGLQKRLTTARQGHQELSEACEGLAGLAIHEKVVEAAGEAQKEVNALKALRDRLVTAQGSHASLLIELDAAETEAVGAQAEVEALLGDMGECPTCGTAMDAAHLGAHA